MQFCCLVYLSDLHPRGFGQSFGVVLKVFGLLCDQVICYCMVDGFVKVIYGRFSV